ncbi:MAG: glycosyltransferase [Microbacteriaceae bacterium]|nr:MAG: glycosyltransferase [Microbacteriaceae bacterium]
MGRVAAVVVTYNRLEKLRTVLASIDAQSARPEWIVVVDNASTDGTGAWLEEVREQYRLDIVTSPTNTGGAGGFALGMQRGYDLGADAVWIMDDDCYPGERSLELLDAGLSAASRELGYEVPFACSVVTFTDGEICEMNNPTPTWDWARLWAKGQRSVLVSSCSFVSVLVPRGSLERHGLPYAEYFIWFDDQEYTLRLSRADGAGVQVLDSVVVHDMGDNKGVNFSHITEANAWKFAYGIRNEASYQLHHRGFASWLMFAARVLVLMHRGGVAWRLRMRMIGRLFAGIGFNPKVAPVR